MKLPIKIKKYLSEKFLFFTVVLLCVCSGLYLFVFHGGRQDNKRVPASYTLYTPEVESRSKEMMEESRRLHIIEDYQSANKTLSDLLNKYPYAGYREEASYLLAKGLFYEGELAHSEEVIQNLREYAPDSLSKWMGNSLLIMGKIHENREEVDKAMLLYRHVISEFPDKNLVDTAENLLMEMSF